MCTYNIKDTLQTNQVIFVTSGTEDPGADKSQEKSYSAKTDFLADIVGRLQSSGSSR